MPVRLDEGDSPDPWLSLVGAAKVEVEDEIAKVARISEELEEIFIVNVCRTGYCLC